jgi:hypothetical protein
MNMPSFIEVSWIREGGDLTYIDPNIETMVGYTAHEVRAMDDPVSALVAPSHAKNLCGLLDGGPPNKLVPKMLPLVLRHKAGHNVCCHATLICRYGDDGQLVELWGALRQLRDQCQFSKLESWWHAAPRMAHQALCDSMALLFPAPA